MSDFFEIDFLNIESEKSGDAIPLEASQNLEVKNADNSLSEC